MVNVKLVSAASRGVLVLLLAILVGSPVAAQERGAGDKLDEAQMLIGQENFGEAAKLLKEVTEAEPQNANGWFLLGYALHMAGDLDDALKAHKKAAEFDQFSGIATYNVGCAYSLKGDKDQALLALNKAVDLGFEDSNQFKIDTDLNFLRTDVRFAKLMARLVGQDDAIEQLEDAEKLVAQQEFAEAAEIYRAITEADDENEFAWYRLGYCVHGTGDLDKALEIHTRAAKFQGVSGIATYNIGCVHSLQGNKDKAFASFNKAVEKGFARVDAFENDPDLDNIRQDERFDELMKKVREKSKRSS